MRDDNVGAVHLTVLSALPGRLRLQLEKPIEGEAIFLSIPGLQSCRYNPRIPNEPPRTRAWKAALRPSSK